MQPASNVFGCKWKVTKHCFCICRYFNLSPRLSDYKDSVTLRRIFIKFVTQQFQWNVIKYSSLLECGNNHELFACSS